MTPLKKANAEMSERHIWGRVLRTRPHICRSEALSRSFFSEPNHMLQSDETLIFLNTKAAAIAAAASAGAVAGTAMSESQTVA